MNIENLLKEMLKSKLDESKNKIYFSFHIGDEFYFSTDDKRTLDILSELDHLGYGEAEIYGIDEVDVEDEDISSHVKYSDAKKALDQLKRKNFDDLDDEEAIEEAEKVIGKLLKI